MYVLFLVLLPNLAIFYHSLPIPGRHGLQQKSRVSVSTTNAKQNHSRSNKLAIGEFI